MTEKEVEALQNDMKELQLAIAQAAELGADTTHIQAQLDKLRRDIQGLEAALMK